MREVEELYPQFGESQYWHSRSHDGCYKFSAYVLAEASMSTGPLANSWEWAKQIYF